MSPRAGLVTGVLVAVATGALAVAIGVTLLLTHIIDLRTAANATLRTGTYLDATTGGTVGLTGRSTSSAWPSTPKPACAAT